MTERVCPHCHRPVINPGGHAEACTGPNPNDSPYELQELDGTNQPRHATLIIFTPLVLVIAYIVVLTVIKLA